MLDTVIARDVPNSTALRPRVRPHHLEYIQRLDSRVIQVRP
jgi:uncharacterized protein YciI